MQNNFILTFLVPEISLSILSMLTLIYGLFINKDSFRKTSNFAILILVITSILIYFDFKTEFANFNNFFSHSDFIKFFKFLVLFGSISTLIISKN